MRARTRRVFGACAAVAVASAGACSSDKPSLGVGATPNASDAGAEGGDADVGAPCGQDARYQYSGIGAWDETVFDRNSGLTWRRGIEEDSTLGACDGNPHETAYCCSSDKYAACNWLGAQQYCTSHGSRLPSKDELLAIAGASYTACAFESWWSWSASPAGTGRAWYVSHEGNTAAINISDYGLYAVRCVR